ncbi:efflux RND transporter periplasmic adaptor subunit [Mongoliitalea daihaiensis]|uniref:efflux RND transporter periplasmic adaptor subunit n=1 Tax=Mongoliitalea daihaiensis TaxID=2782006 RepID=UPI001F46740B|nr:efflux RND transporter periplasmic adaptor subunit [Mongoliitalea daihaiensis]UJP65807.1 efflux RND transporter periplasmic adaptor subunit [Mongoliitalea daihaiensis]
MKISHFWSALMISVSLFACREKSQTITDLQSFQVVEIIAQEVPLSKEFVGQVYGKADIPIRARVDGFVERIHFQEGLEVKKGQLLYTIDDSPFRLDVAREQSRLSEAQVNLVNATNDLTRIEPLVSIKAISERDWDAAKARKSAAEESVKAATANLELSKVNLSYTKIIAPLDGVIGKTNAKQGEYVGRSPNPVILNTISQIDSIIVEFFLNEKDYLAFARQFIVENRNQRDLKSRPLELFLADGERFPYLGEITFLNRNIDPSTGSILVQSKFPNPDKLIRPGQFAKVKGVVDILPAAILVPQRCVFELQGFFNVLAVNADGMVSQKRIEILETYQDYFIVQSGLSAGERVLLEGLMTVKPGSQITPELVTFNSQR